MGSLHGRPARMVPQPTGAERPHSSVDHPRRRFWHVPRRRRHVCAPCTAPTACIADDARRHTGTRHMPSTDRLLGTCALIICTLHRSTQSNTHARTHARTHTHTHARTLTHSHTGARHASVGLSTMRRRVSTVRTLAMGQPWPRIRSAGRRAALTSVFPVAQTRAPTPDGAPRAINGDARGAQSSSTRCSCSRQRLHRRTMCVSCMCTDRVTTAHVSRLSPSSARVA